MSLLEASLTRYKVMFRKASKYAQAKGKMPTKPRSQYIGVSKNGAHWQALVVVNKKKVYMGTYHTEQQAAIVFDFHSMLMHYKDAKVNFDYTGQQLHNMIEVFFENDNEFDVKQYLEQAQWIADTAQYASISRFNH